MLTRYLKRIQGLPLVKRKIILWVIIIILGLILCFFWIRNIQYKIRSFSKEKFFEEMGLPKLKEGWENLPKPEMPKLEIEENLRKLEETQKK